MKPIDLHGLKTYDLQSRPSQVFAEDLGRPLSPEGTLADWIDALPRQLGGKDLRQVREHLCRAHAQQCSVVAAVGAHVVKSGCSPYLIDWIERGRVTGLAMTGAAALHDFELALAGKTGEDASRSLPTGRYGMARETADAFAVASRTGAERGIGLGAALGQHMEDLNCPHTDISLLLAAHRAGIPCTVHLAIGTDTVHMHPHVSGAALGEATHLDFRILCNVVSGLRDGIWLHLGSAVVLPEVFLKAVAVVRNFGHNLDGLVTVVMDRESLHRSHAEVLERPASEAYELIGPHELLLPLLHAAVACELAETGDSLQLQGQAA